MGNVAVKENNENSISEKSAPSSGTSAAVGGAGGGNSATAAAISTSTTSSNPVVSAIAARKHSTVSTARLLFSTEKVEFLSEEQKGHIRNCWKRIEEDVARVGVITFVQLFETHPDVKEVFMPFQGMKVEELQHSKQLRAHALRVMAFVQKAVARLDEKDKLDKLLEELGRSHFYYGAPKKYMEFVGPQFIRAIEPSLQDIWSKELHDAWTGLFRYIAHHMKEAITAAEKEKRGSK